MPSKTEEYLALAQRTANGLTRYWESWTAYLTTAFWFTARSQNGTPTNCPVLLRWMQNIKIQTMIEPFGELITLLLPVQPPIRAWSTPSNIHSQEKCSIPVMVPAGGISRIPCWKS